jgi:hypothetical protein
LVRITFLGERQDIFDPVAAVPFAGTSPLQLLSVLERLCRQAVTATASANA